MSILGKNFRLEVFFANVLQHNVGQDGKLSPIELEALLTYSGMDPEQSVLWVKQFFSGFDPHMTGRVRVECFIDELQRMTLFKIIRQMSNNFEAIDTDDSGFIEYEEFYQALRNVLGQAAAEQYAGCLFSQIDKDNSASVSLEELDHWYKSFHHRVRLVQQRKLEYEAMQFINDFIVDPADSDTKSSSGPSPNQQGLRCKRCGVPETEQTRTERTCRTHTGISRLDTTQECGNCGADYPSFGSYQNGCVACYHFFAESGPIVRPGVSLQVLKQMSEIHGSYAISPRKPARALSDDEPVTASPEPDASSSSGSTSSSSSSSDATSLSHPAVPPIANMDKVKQAPPRPGTAVRAQQTARATARIVTQRGRKFKVPPCRCQNVVTFDCPSCGTRDAFTVSGYHLCLLHRWVGVGRNYTCPNMECDKRYDPMAITDDVLALVKNGEASFDLLAPETLPPEDKELMRKPPHSLDLVRHDVCRCHFHVNFACPSCQNQGQFSVTGRRLCTIHPYQKPDGVEHYAYIRCQKCDNAVFSQRAIGEHAREMVSSGQAIYSLNRTRSYQSRSIEDTKDSVKEMSEMNVMHPENKSCRCDYECTWDCPACEEKSSFSAKLTAVCLKHNVAPAVRRGRASRGDVAPKDKMQCKNPKCVQSYNRTRLYRVIAQLEKQNKTKLVLSAHARQRQEMAERKRARRSSLSDITVEVMDNMPRPENYHYSLHGFDSISDGEEDHDESHSTRRQRFLQSPRKLGKSKSHRNRVYSHSGVNLTNLEGVPKPNSPTE